MRRVKVLLIIILLAAAIGAVGFAVFRFLTRDADSVTAEEWIVKKYELIGQLETFSSSLDDVMSLYSIGSISTQDLANEVYIAQSELAIMKRLYDQDLEEHPIRTGTHTYETKKGMEGLETIWESYEMMLDQLADICTSSGSANDAAYVYLAYREPVTSGLFDYMQAYYSVTDPSRMLSAWSGAKEETETGMADTNQAETSQAGTGQTAASQTEAAQAGAGQTGIGQEEPVELTEGTESLAE